MIWLNGALLRKRVNVNMSGMRAKEIVFFAYTFITLIHMSKLLRLERLEIT